MKFVARGGGREETIELEPTADGYRARLGDREIAVGVARSGSSLSLLIEGRQSEVAVHRRSRGRYLVSDGSWSGEIEVLDPLQHLAGTGSGGAGQRGSERVSAYMPGRVVTVLVAEGDEVEPGQGIVVLEAMKMENEIPAETAGRVVRIHVETGQAVETGDPLFDIE